MARSFRDRGGEMVRVLTSSSTFPWERLSIKVRNRYCDRFDELVHLGSFLGIRIEDDQVPGGPDVGGGDG